MTERFYWSNAAACAQHDTSNENVSQAIGLKLNGASLLPFSRPRPGRYFTFQVIVSNTGSVAQSAMIVASCERSPSFQAISHVTLGPGESSGVRLRLKVPVEATQDGALDISLSLNSNSQSNRILVLPNGQPSIDTIRFPIETKRFVTGTILEPIPQSSPEWLFPKDDLLMSYELLAAANVDADMTRHMLSMDDGRLPCEMIDWNSVDAVVIGRKDGLTDPTAMNSLLQWIESGGRAWIMLDKVEPIDLEELLPQGMNCRVIDDDYLSDFVVELGPNIQMKVEERTVRSNKPFLMKRILQVGGVVSHSVNGFPIAIDYTIGRGSLLVTTLSAEAWMMSRPSNNQPLQRNSSYQVRNWARPLTDRFLENRETRTPIETAEVVYPMKLIGNPVLDRNFVMECMFVYCALLLVSSTICWYLGKLVSLGWIFPLISMMGCAPILLGSLQIRRDTPDATAHLQLVEVMPGSKSIQIREWTSIFRTDVSTSQLHGKVDVVFDWALDAAQGDQRTLTWQDFQDWRLSSTGWPTGIWRMRSSSSIKPRAMEATLALTRTGLSIQTSEGIGQPLEDSVLMVVPGNPSLCGRLEPNVSTAVPEGRSTVDESWIGNTIVNDEQSRRDEVYHQLIARGTRPAYPSYPAVMGWTKLWPSDLSWDDSREERGAALVVIPVRLMPVPVGEEIRVPHCLIRMTARNDGVMTTAFSNLSGMWRDPTTVPQTIPIRFSLPAQVMPLKVSELELEIQLRAPQRDVRVASVAPNAKPIAELRSPVGNYRYTLTDPAVLEESHDGWIDLTIDIGDDLGSGMSSSGSWQIDFVRLNASGVVQER